MIHSEQTPRASLPALGNGGLNTILLGIVLALSGWTLNRVSTLSEKMAGVTVSVSGQTVDMDALRARLSLAEAQIQANAIAIARIQKTP